MEQIDYLHDYIIKRYLQNDEHDWCDIVKRVSKLYPPIEPYLKTMKFIPGGRNLATINTNHITIPNCVVVDIEDDLSNIFNTMTRLMELTRRGAGIGMNFGKLRPAGTHAKQFDAKSCGPVGFLNMYSIVMRTVQQMSRHGAFIGILPVTHPDIINFIEVKQDLSKINNFNLSVLIDDEFINNVRNHPDDLAVANYTIKHNDGTIETITDYNYITYDNNFVVQDITPIKITYYELFEDIIKCMWTTGEPGILFKDNINNNNILQPLLGDITACNPCGELPMYPNECCNLGSINLANFTETINYNPRDNNDLNIFEFVNKYVNISDLRQCVYNAVIFLDKVIDIINTEDEEINEFVRQTRRIGLGVMGLHDMLICLKIPYDTPEAILIVENILNIIKDEAYKTSSLLVNGIVNDYNGELYITPPRGNVIDRFDKDRQVIKTDINRANLTLLTIAPNGSTSMLVNVSSGIEPYFSLGYYRMIDNATTKTGLIINKQLKKWLRCNVADDIREKVTHDIITNGINNIDDNIIPPYIKEVFKTAQDILPYHHILMLSIAQTIIDNAISKTINLPEETTEQEIMDCVLLAHDLKIKGMTVYRDNCRQNVINNSVIHKNNNNNNKDNIPISLSLDSCKDGSCDI